MKLLPACGADRMSDYCEECGVDLPPSVPWLPSPWNDIAKQAMKRCTKCYQKYQRQLWADLPDHLAEATYVARELNKLPEDQRLAVAMMGLGKRAHASLKGKAAELLIVVKRSIEGPYGEQILTKLQAIENALSSGKTKRNVDQETD